MLPKAPLAKSAVAHVVVEDVSLADAPARIVGEQRLHLEQFTGDASFSVGIASSVIDPSRSYSVRVHIAQEDREEIKKGDFVSTQAYPVLTHGAGNQLVVQVSKV